MAAAVDQAKRRTLVRRELASGDVAGLRDLAGRLEAQGAEATADQLRSDIRALGAIRVQHGDGTVLALPADGGAARGSAGGGAGARLSEEIAADADWPIQVAVVAVVALFLLVGLLGWLISV